LGSFEVERLPRQEGNYVEWVILVTMRSRVDRVLIRAIIHEAGLGDLDGLRRSVADLRVDEGWLVTSLWVSPAVKQVLNKSQEGLTCLTFDELIDQDANFAPYLAWLEAEIRRRELEKYYVPLGCTKGEFDGSTKTLRGVSSYPVSEGGIDLYIDRWLENPMNEHVSILGEFGTGKTWFVLHYAGRCLRAYLEAKRKGLPRPRLPLVIPLRDYAKALNVENVLAGFFYTQHNIRLNSAVFDRLNQMGKLLLIFDGFDEMADKVDHQKMIDNFWELAKVVTTNAKVILTCRTEHFPTAQVGRDTLRGELLASTARLTGVPPQFETLELMKFDDVQIRDVLGRRTNELTVEKVMGNGQVLDLLRRAVMAEFVLAALPEIEARKPKEIDLARVYLYAVRRQMEENITTGRTFTSLADKLYFLCELSWEMLSTDRMSLNYREFPEHLRRLFGSEVESQKDLDHWHYDMMGQTMLVRNDDGDYSPAHRSLLEFFVAYKFAAELGLLSPDFLVVDNSQLETDNKSDPRFCTWSNWRYELNKKSRQSLTAPLSGFISEPLEELHNTFGKSPLTKSIVDLLIPILNLKVKYREPNFLLDLLQNTNADEFRCIGGNAATVLVNINPSALEYQDLSGTSLSHANLIGIGLKGTNFSNSNLDNCLTTMVFGAVNAIVVSKKSQKIITAHDDNTIRIWDQSSSRELQKLIGHQGSVNCLALSHDEQLLYSGSNDGNVKEWRLIDGVCQQTFHGHKDWVRAIVLDMEENLLFSASHDGTINKWSLADGICQSTFYGHQNSVNTIALNVNKQLLYSGSDDGNIKEWRLSDGICQRTFSGHQGWVNVISLSINGNLLYSGSYDETIKEWNLSDGICQRTFTGDQGWVNAIVLSDDGYFLYSGSYAGVVKEWRLSDGICQRVFERHQSWVRAIALSKDGKILYSGSGDRTVKMWGLSDGICQNTFVGHPNSVNALSLNEDETLLYSGSYDGTIKEWRLADNICQSTFFAHQNSVNALLVSKDGKMFYSGSGDGTIKEWRLDDGICQRTFIGHLNSVNTLSLSKSGGKIYSGSDDGTVKEWNLYNGNQHTFECHQGLIRGIALSDDGEVFYSGGGDRIIKEWRISDSSHQELKGHHKWIRVITLSRDGQLIYSGSDDSTIKEWNLSNGNCQRTFSGHQSWVNVIITSNDGKSLYSGSGSGDGTIKVWCLVTGECISTLQGNQDWIRALALSKNGKLLYSGGNDGTIKLWCLATEKCISTIDTRLCAGANITGARGLTPAQTDSLIALGAFDDNRK
jgi:WD40 repeat protein